MELSLESRAPRLSTLPAFSAETVFVRSPPRAHAEAIARLRAVVRTCGRAGSGNLSSTCLILSPPNSANPIERAQSTGEIRGYFCGYQNSSDSKVVLESTVYLPILIRIFD